MTAPYHPMSKRSWGPALWHSLHVIAEAYPEQPTPTQQRACANLILALPDMLPCRRCGMHYAKFLEGAQTMGHVCTRSSHARDACTSRDALRRHFTSAHNNASATVARERNLPVPGEWTPTDTIARWGSPPMGVMCSSSPSL